MLGFNYVVNCASKLYNCWFRAPVSARSYRASVFLFDWLSYFSVKRINLFIHSYLVRNFAVMLLYCCCCWWCYRRCVATELPLRYRKLITKTSRCYTVVAGLWTAALITFIAPLLTKPNWIYYRYNVHQKMCGLHWEYPSFCIATTLYIPILSGTVLVITALRIRATLRRQNVKIRLRQNKNTPVVSADSDDQQSGTRRTVRRSTALGSRRTLKILTFTSIAFFTFWSPYVVVVMLQSFFAWFKPPAAVEFTVMWMANSNSAVNVFIYSSTNTQFRRQCVRLASRLFCYKLSCLSHSKHPNTGHKHPTQAKASSSLVTFNQSTLNVEASTAHPLDEAASSQCDDSDCDGAHLLTVLPAQSLSVSHMKHAVIIESHDSDENDCCPE